MKLIKTQEQTNLVYLAFAEILKKAQPAPGNPSAQNQPILAPSPKNTNSFYVMPERSRAREIAKERGLAVQEVSLGQLKNRFVGETERKIKVLFASFSSLKNHAIILEDIESLAPRDASPEIIDALKVGLDNLTSTMQSNNTIVISIINYPRNVNDAILRRLSSNGEELAFNNESQIKEEKEEKEEEEEFLRHKIGPW